jgi:hypothetical protein
VNASNGMSVGEQTKAMHTAVGEAISAWSFVEEALLNIYVSAVSLTTTTTQGGVGHTRNDPAAVAVLHSVRGFDSKLKMIDAALKTNLKGLDEEAESILECWKSAKKSADSLTQHRNRLAHSHVMGVGGNDGTTEVCLLPPLHGDKYIAHLLGDNRRIMLQEIIQWKKSFYKCADKLKKILRRIGSHEGLRDEFLKRMANQIFVILQNDRDVLSRLTANAPWLCTTQASGPGCSRNDP